MLKDVYTPNKEFQSPISQNESIQKFLTDTKAYCNTKVLIKERFDVPKRLNYNVKKAIIEQDNPKETEVRLDEVEKMLVEQKVNIDMFESGVGTE